MTMFIFILKIVLLACVGLMFLIFVLCAIALLFISDDWESEYGEPARNHSKNGGRNDAHP